MMKKLFVIFSAIMLVAAFTVPAMAADWNFYGSARMKTFSQDTEAAGGATSDRDTDWNIQSNARIGARVKGGDVGGRFEYGTSGGNANIRLLYGTWKFGPGTLLVGQDYTPLTLFYSTQVYGTDAALLHAGGHWDSRRPQITVKMGGFKVALVNPNGQSALGTGGDVDTTIPKINAKYTFKTKQFGFDVSAAYHTYTIERAGLSDLDVDSYVLTAGAKVNLGPAYVRVMGNLTQNAGTYGILSNRANDDPIVNAAGTDIVDNEGYTYAVIVGFKPNKKLDIQAGYGFTGQELDQAGSIEDETSQYYIQASITLAPGVYIIPTVGYQDWEDDNTGADQQEFSYFGAKWMINF